MLSYLFASWFFLIGIIAIFCSRSDKFMLKATEQNGKTYSDKLKKMLNMGGYISIVCALLLFAITFLKSV
jgi:hypothetical protein